VLTGGSQRGSWLRIPAPLIGADIGGVPRQDLLLDQDRQVDGEVVVAGAVPFRGFRRIVSHVGEVAGIDDRRHCVACPVTTQMILLLSRSGSKSSRVRCIPPERHLPYFSRPSGS
jgi:hypothetical protein